MFELQPTTEDHIFQVAGDIRGVDAKEIWHALGLTPLAGLHFIHQRATKCATMVYKGVPAAVAGLNETDLLFKVACPFFVATNFAAAHPRAFAKHSKASIQELFGGYFLRNWVAEENKLAQGWLRWLGFYVSDDITAISGLPVRLFAKDMRN
jgi:hypothetical protein